MAEEVKDGEVQHGRFREISATGQSAPLRVDVEKGIIHDVLFLGTKKSGRGRQNGVYSTEVIRKDIAKYEGVPTYVGHTKDGSNPEYRDKLGVHRNVRATAEGGRSDFHFNVDHPCAKQLIWDAQNDPAHVGFSQDAECNWKPGAGGRRVITSIDQVHSLDLVTNPATTRGLFHEEDGLYEDEQRMLESDPPLKAFAESSLAAMDDARCILFEVDVPVETKRTRMLESLIEWRGHMLEGEIADEMAKDEPRHKMRRIRDTADRMIDEATWGTDKYPTHKAKRDRHVAILTDAIKELKAVDCGGSTLKEEETMEYKEITVETLSKERPDLVAVLKGTDEKSRMTEEAKALQAKVTAQDAELATLRAKESRRVLEEEIAGELKAANFPVTDERAYSAVFKEELLASDKTKRAALVADRMQVFGSRMQEEFRQPAPLTEFRPALAAAPDIDHSYDYLFGVKV